MKQQLYWLGNAAKSRVIAEILAHSQSSETVTVFDYGCGDGGDWPAILADHPTVRLIGYEPYAPSCRTARERLRQLRAEVFGGHDIETLEVKADFVVSFSVFEHVARRQEFLRHAKRILAPEGTFFLNYDDGHFRNLLDISRPGTWMPAVRAWGRTMVSRPLAAFGRLSRYQQRVNAREVDRLVLESGFRIERVDYHNLPSLKDLAKGIPEELRQDYAVWWLNAEKYLNETFHAEMVTPRYGDTCNLWQQMVSRTLCLRHIEPPAEDARKDR